MVVPVLLAQMEDHILQAMEIMHREEDQELDRRRLPKGVLVGIFKVRGQTMAILRLEVTVKEAGE